MMIKHFQHKWKYLHSCHVSLWNCFLCPRCWLFMLLKTCWLLAYFLTSKDYLVFKYFFFGVSNFKKCYEIFFSCSNWACESWGANTCSVSASPGCHSLNKEASIRTAHNRLHSADLWKELWSQPLNYYPASTGLWHFFRHEGLDWNRSNSVAQTNLELAVWSRSPTYGNSLASVSHLLGLEAWTGFYRNF